MEKAKPIHTTKWQMVKYIIASYRKLPLSLYLKEKCDYYYAGVENGRIRITVKSWYSGKVWEVDLSPTQFLRKLDGFGRNDLIERFGYAALPIL
ncbi:MAG: hypothetical protein C0172_03055 [Caldisphaera sp.]|nr:MAG: hypothetical protein C0172_03055 [Caldisphaera sp.]